MVRFPFKESGRGECEGGGGTSDPRVTPNPATPPKRSPRRSEIQSDFRSRSGASVFAHFRLKVVPGGANGLKSGGKVTPKGALLVEIAREGPLTKPSLKLG